MIRPLTLNHSPSAGVLVLGGMTGMLLMMALLFLFGTADSALFDLPRLIGGIFTTNSGAAFWLGFWLFFAGGVLAFPLLLRMGWNSLPGEDVGFAGALVKGLLFGLALWLLTGLILPLLALINRLGIDSPGFFGLEHGWPAAAVLLVGTLAYGVAVALVAAMTQGLTPLDLLGWKDYGSVTSPKEGPLDQEINRAL